MCLSEIGYFAVAQWVINASQTQYTIRKPIFVIDEKLAKDFNLKRKIPYHLRIVSTYLLKLIIKNT